jgi:hypothetical protein
MMALQAALSWLTSCALGMSRVQPLLLLECPIDQLEQLDGGIALTDQRFG